MGETINISSEYKLLTLKDLSKRWNKNEKTIKRYVTDGKLKYWKNLGCIFRSEEITRFEGGEPSDFSYIERRNLLAEINLWKEKYKKLNDVLNEVFQVASKVSNVNIEILNELKLSTETCVQTVQNLLKICI